eukprot:scaffold14946_cov125-Isochrysis_galbana.AAC.1
MSEAQCRGLYGLCTLTRARCCSQLRSSPLPPAIENSLINFVRGSPQPLQRRPLRLRRPYPRP